MFLGTGLAKAGQRMAGLIPLLSASREGQQFISCQARGSEKDSLFPPGLSSCFWQRQILALLRCHPCPLGVPRHVTTLGSGPAEMSIGHSAQPSGPLGGWSCILLPMASPSLKATVGACLQGKHAGLGPCKPPLVTCLFRDLLWDTGNASFKKKKKRTPTLNLGLVLPGPVRAGLLTDGTWPLRVTQVDKNRSF